MSAALKMDASIPPEVRARRPWKLSSYWARIFAGILHDRLWELNKNFLVIFVGETGSGKSYSALAMAEMIDPEFSLEKVVYNPRDFLKLLDETKKGDVIVFDEAGVGIPSREWQSIQNKLVGYVLQTFRYKNVGVFFTVPSMNFIDKQVRILTHYVVKVYGHMNDQTKCVVYEQDHDPVHDYLNWKPWIFRDKKRGIEHDPNPVFIGIPSEHIVEEYERISQERKGQVYQEALEHIKALEEGLKGTGAIDGRSLRRMRNIIAAFYKLYQVYRKEHGLSNRAIAHKIGVSDMNLRNWIAWIEANRRMFESI